MTPENPSSTLAQLRETRLDKAQKLRDLGVDPYPSRSSRSMMTADVVRRIDELTGGEAVVAGRLGSIRRQGGLTFATIADESGQLQAVFQRKEMTADSALAYADLSLLDTGDIVEAAGIIRRSQRGEPSIFARSVRPLAKSVRPLPDQWHGLRDREAVLRKRYLDTIMDRSAFERYRDVYRMLAGVRRFLADRNFTEVLTPILQPMYGGGTANPFRTHLDALDVDMYLAISHELYLKRLIIGGFENVYTIGRYFRNEGMDRTHHPEFAMIETMSAYRSYLDNMELVESMFRFIATDVFGKDVYHVRDADVDMVKPWRRLTMRDGLHEQTGIDFGAMTDVAQAREALRRLGVADEVQTVGHALSAAFEELVAPGLIQPTLVYGHPVEISPLAKPLADDPRYAERFEIYIAGGEIGDNWSEQNDPVALLQRWRSARAERAMPENELHPLDYDFIEAIEYGMPPTSGIGPGIERMAMIFTESDRIEDVIFFPLMRPWQSPLNLAIYENAAMPHEEPAGG